MMHGVHIGGQRAGGFLELVRGVDPKRVLLVGIDVAKATWFVVAANLLGVVVVDGVRLVADRAGLVELQRVLGPPAPGSMRPWSWSGSRRPGTSTRRWSPTCLTVTGCWGAC